MASMCKIGQKYVQRRGGMVGKAVQWKDGLMGG